MSNHPQHIGLIPDGTRRWAKLKDVPLSSAYLHAMKKISTYVDLFFSSGCQAVSLYLCSKENLERPSNEVAAFTDAETSLCADILPKVLDIYNVKVLIAGTLDLLPNKFRVALEELKESTSLNKNCRLYLCASYDPIDEIKKAAQISNEESDFFGNLWVPETLDLVIRTAGANRLSNFLPLQSGYAEIYIIEKLFNETNIDDIQNAIELYKNTHRSLGV